MKIILIALLFCSIAFSKENKYEVRTAPIALLARWVTADFSIALNPNIAVGPSVVIYASPEIGNMFLPSYSGYALGAHAYYYLVGFSENGFYGGSHFYYENFSSYPHGVAGHSELTGTKINLVGGYQFITVTKFNILAGLGLESRNYSQNNISNDPLFPATFSDRSGAGAFIEFKVGYKF